MYLPDFEYLAPRTLDEACRLLSDYGPEAKILAGGTDILVKMKGGLLAPKAVISLKYLDDLRGIRYVPDRGVVIGARATPNEIMDSPVLHERYLSVSEAAHTMAAHQIRNRGTIGGNIVNAIPSADLPPILIALGATITLVGLGGERSMLLEDFFTGVCETVCTVGEIVTEVVIPDQPTTGSTYHKFALRRAGALAVVGVAAAVTMDDGVVRDPRIVLGAVATTPVRAPEAEELLEGRVPTDAILEDVGVIAASGCCWPINDIRGSEEYRRDLVRVFTRRALKRAINEGHV
ncbi:MAG: FAD binding domain-containing protein [Thermoleophilia bacterium]